jgi:hypothetical protein
VRFIAAIDEPLRNGFPKVALSTLDLQRKKPACCAAFEDDLKMRVDSNVAHCLFAK